jgi:hypothetical protein
MLTYIVTLICIGGALRCCETNSLDAGRLRLSRHQGSGAFEPELAPTAAFSIYFGAAPANRNHQVCTKYDGGRVLSSRTCWLKGLQSAEFWRVVRCKRWHSMSAAGSPPPTSRPSLYTGWVCSTARVSAGSKKVSSFDAGVRVATQCRDQFAACTASITSLCTGLKGSDAARTGCGEATPEFRGFWKLGLCNLGLLARTSRRA